MSNLTALYARSRQVELARAAARRCCGIVRHATRPATRRRLGRGRTATCCA